MREQASIEAFHSSLRKSSVALDLSSCKCSSNSSDAAISNCGSFYSSATTILDCREARVEYCRPHKMKSSSPSWSAIPNRSTMSPNRTHPVHVPAQYRKQGKTPSRRPRVSKIFLASTNFQQSLWQKPPSSTLKCNQDTTIFFHLNSSGIDLCIHS